MAIDRLAFAFLGFPLFGCGSSGTTGQTPIDASALDTSTGADVGVSGDVGAVDASATEAGTTLVYLGGLNFPATIQEYSLGLGAGTAFVVEDARGNVYAVDIASRSVKATTTHRSLSRSRRG